MAQGNRSYTDILAQILNTANYSGSITKSKIMYKANISYTQVKEYTSVMVANDLLKYDENEQTYKVTDRGLRFLEVYEHINELIHC